VGALTVEGDAVHGPDGTELEIVTATTVGDKRKPGGKKTQTVRLAVNKDKKWAIEFGSTHETQNYKKKTKALLGPNESAITNTITAKDILSGDDASTSATVETKFGNLWQGIELMQAAAEIKHETENLVTKLRAEWEKLGDDERKQITAVLEGGNTTGRIELENLPEGWRRLLQVEYDPGENLTLGGNIEQLPSGTWARAWATVAGGWGELSANVEALLDGQQFKAELEAAIGSAEEIKAEIEAMYKQTQKGTEAYANLKATYKIAENLLGKLKMGFDRGLNRSTSYEFSKRIEYENAEKQLNWFVEYSYKQGEQKGEIGIEAEW